MVFNEEDKALGKNFYWIKGATDNGDLCQSFLEKDGKGPDCTNSRRG